jgi:hypothetical protein
VCAHAAAAEQEIPGHTETIEHEDEKRRLRSGERLEGIRKHAVDRISPTVVVLDNLVGDIRHRHELLSFAGGLKSFHA